MDLVRRSRVLVIGLLAFSVVVSACASTNETEADTLVGQAGAANELAPDFTVPTASGGTFSLSQHLANDGRPVFLNLWASWCFPCREEMPDIEASSLEFTDILFIGVAVQDSRADADAFRKEVAVTYEIGFDEDDSVDIAYSPLGLPASYIISSEGVILERIFGKMTEQDLAEKFEAHFG
ncbi:MAG: TlpA family protein disulfide reductase [Actinomycetia bacterium]|nr:TlpA family protein disulfide reductase [Actinomycetes bacterium]